MLREALAELPDGTSYGDPTEASDVYIPRSHLKAIDPDTLLVIGMRGAGKTFWWSALQENAVRQLVGRQHRRSVLGPDTEVHAGFGVTASADRYPSKDVLGQLLDANIEPRIIWRTVQAWQIADERHALRREKTWLGRAGFIEANPELVDRLFRKHDSACAERDVYSMFLFDALDRCADDWKTMYRLIRGLLQTALDMRSYMRLRVKVFLRSDQVNEAEISDFPDASKVFSSSVELNWPRHELYGLLWHYLGNLEGDGSFRDFLGGEWGQLALEGQEVFLVPRRQVTEQGQRDRFHEITGPWMGRGPKRGFPYTWIPNHLADTDGRVSPRSFLAALRTAAEDTREQHPDHAHALHFDSIKRGVQSASVIRVREIKEDYPWIDRALGPLRGLVVPCDFKEVSERWARDEVLDHLSEQVANDEVKLPPRDLVDGPDGVRRDLESLGIFQRLRDERVNMPDVFRVGYGLGRKGGVRPAR